MDVVSPAYSYFLDCVRQQYPIHTTRGGGGGKVMITAKQMSTDFKQYFRYDRFKELVSKQTHYNYIVIIIISLWF